jgi:hypothetical protein
LAHSATPAHVVEPWNASKSQYYYLCIHEQLTSRKRERCKVRSGSLSLEMRGSRRANQNNNSELSPALRKIVKEF